MTAEIEILNQIKEVVIDCLLADKEKAKALMYQPKAQTYINARIEMFEELNLLLHKLIKEGDGDIMGKLKSEIRVLGEVKIEDLMVSQRGGTIQPKILEIAKDTKVGSAKEVDSEGISYQYFDGQIRQMIKKGLLTEEYRPIKRGNKFFLARFTKEQMSAYGYGEKGK